MLAGARTDVDEPIGGADGVLVMLDDQHGVTEITQPQEGLDQAVVVALMQTDRRLVEYVQGSDET